MKNVFRILKDWFDVTLIGLVGLFLIYAASFSDQRLEKLYNFLDPANWNYAFVIACAVTIVFIVGWVRTFQYFKSGDLDDYNSALAARFMRMSVCVDACAWLYYVANRPEFYDKLRVVCDRMFRLGIYSVTWLTIFLVTIFFVLVTIFFFVKWFTLRFMKF